MKETLHNELYRRWHTPSKWPILLLLAASLSLAVACERDKAAPPTAELTIAAAADLRYAMEDLIIDFQDSRPDDSAGLAMRVTYGSSGNFYAQLTQRAPFDLYFSADIAYPAKLAQAGHALDDEVFEYAIGRIVVWVPDDSELEVEKLQWVALQSPSVRRIAIANPDHAPYGVAAVAAMKSAELYDEVSNRLVYGENISQAAQFIDSGSADVGIIALALAVAPAMRDRGRYWEIPLEQFPTMHQGGLITGWTPHPEEAREFRDYVAGPRGREILERYGFFLPDEEP